MNSQLFLELGDLSKNMKEIPIIPIDVTPLFLCKNGALFEIDGVDFLKSIPTNSVDMVFADALTI